MHALQPSLRPKFSQETPARYKATASAQGFDSMIKQMSEEKEYYSKIPLDQVETKMVKVKTVDEHGHVKEVMKEVAICPECGEENCPCIARITVQQRLDEENAKGVRNAEKPNPLAILPHSYNQMSLNLNKSTSSPYFR